MKKSLKIISLVFLFFTSAAEYSNAQEITLDNHLIGKIILGKTDSVKALIAAGANVNKRFDFGASKNISPLYLAVRLGEYDIAKILIDSGANAKMEFNGLNLIHIAALSGGNETIVELLIKNGLDVNAKSSKGETPLDLAIITNQKETAILLMQHGGEQGIIAQDKSAIRDAIRHQNSDEIKRLLESGVDVNEGYDFYTIDDITPLFQACTFNFLFPSGSDKKNVSIEIIKLLLEAGADLDEKVEGMTILPFAINKIGDTTIIKPLVKAGLDINVKNKYRQTALHEAAYLGKTEWIVSLIANRADLDASDKDGFTPLHWSLINHKYEAAEILVENGANLNIGFNGGNTPLHYAVKENKKELVLKIIAKGAYLNYVNNNGQTPLDLAVKRNNKELADLLKKNGGKSGNE